MHCDQDLHKIILFTNNARNTFQKHIIYSKINEKRLNFETAVLISFQKLRTYTYILSDFYPLPKFNGF